MNNHFALITIGSMLLSAGCQTPLPSEPTDELSASVLPDEPASDPAPTLDNKFSDARVQFLIPKGGVVGMEGATYTVTVGDSADPGDYYMLRFPGAKQTPAVYRQLLEGFRHEIPVQKQNPNVTFTPATETAEHRIAGAPAYSCTWITHSSTEEGKKDFYTTTGYGSTGDNAIWFQHTSTNQKDHPRKLLGFLESVSVIGG